MSKNNGNGKIELHEEAVEFINAAANYWRREAAYRKAELTEAQADLQAERLKVIELARQIRAIEDSLSRSPSHVKAVVGQPIYKVEQLTEINGGGTL